MDIRSKCISEGKSEAWKKMNKKILSGTVLLFFLIVLFFSGSAGNSELYQSEKRKAAAKHYSYLIARGNLPVSES